MNSKKYVYPMMAFLAVFATLAVTSSVSAQTTTPSTQPNGAWAGKVHKGGMMKPAVFGTVSAISGNIITVAGKQAPTTAGATTTTTTYTVDATNAKIMKNNVAGTIASIAIGDTIVVQGTVSGTNVTATNVRDGVMMRGGPGGTNKTGQNMPTIAGNGEPVVAGTVSVINGETLTITNKSNVTYTVDATNAKIVENSNSTATISNIAVGDMVIVQGTVNGNAITASSIIDQAKVASTATSGTTGSQSKGFFGSIGAFFTHLFGF
jgi:hypothetical protein